MSRYGYGRSSGGGLEGAAGGLIGLALVLAVIAFVLLVRAVVFICQTFRRYGKISKGLWKSLWVFVGSIVLCLVLAVIFLALNQPGLAQGVSALPYIGFFQLLMVCKVVQTQYSQTFLKQGHSVVDDVLRKDWWSSYPDTAAAA